MNNVNKTLYIPLYGKAYVSKMGILLSDPMAESIWKQEGFALKGKSASKWLAYYMAMRAAVFDEWTRQAILTDPDAVVVHIGCGLDSRASRIGASGTCWYDVDFPDVITERKMYFSETDTYHMLPVDMRTDSWKTQIPGNRNAIVILEGVSMYFAPEELTTLFSSLGQHFSFLSLLADFYSESAARASKFKNPINDVGVTKVYGWDHPEKLAASSGLAFVSEHTLTPAEHIAQLPSADQWLFRHLYAGSIAKKLYRLYEFRKK